MPTRRNEFHSLYFLNGLLRLPSLFFAGCFIYILLRIRPSLYYQCQVPAFLWDDAFFKQFTVFPGGLLVYLSNLVSQFYFFPIVGALLITLCLVLLYLLTLALLRRYVPQMNSTWPALIPSIIQLMIFSQYEHRLSSTFGLYFTLFVFIIYSRLKLKNNYGRVIIYLVAAIIHYYIAAGYVLFFALLCVIHEVMNKRLFVALSIGTATFLIPPIAQQWLFVLSSKNAYFYLVVPIYHYHPAWAPYLLLAFYPLLISAGQIKSRWMNMLYQKKLPYKHAVPLIIIMMTLFATMISFDSSMNIVLRVDEFARQKKWTKLLHFVQHHQSDDLLVTFQTNRALYHTGRLASDMFAFPQSWGTSGLYLPPEARRFFSIQVSDFYWDLGYLNEAQHWILEDHTNFSNGPWHLQRLADISIVKGNQELAQMCVTALSKTILFQGWAQKYQALLDDPTRIKADSLLGYFHSTMGDKDFIVNPQYPAVDIETIMLNDIDNKMAFEYVMADYMLTFRLGALVYNFSRLPQYYSHNIPRHYQEAALVFIRTSGEKRNHLSGFDLDPEIVAEFTDFLHILQQHQNDAFAARKELEKKYGNTYWFYSLYYNPHMQEDGSSVNVGQ